MCSSISAGVVPRQFVRMGFGFTHQRDSCGGLGPIYMYNSHLSLDRQGWMLWIEAQVENQHCWPCGGLLTIRSRNLNLRVDKKCITALRRDKICVHVGSGWPWVISLLPEHNVDLFYFYLFK